MRPIADRRHFLPAERQIMSATSAKNETLDIKVDTGMKVDIPLDGKKKVKTARACVLRVQFGLTSCPRVSVD